MATLFQALGAIVYRGFTTAERDDLNAKERMTLWNTTTEQWEMYLSGDWRAVLILDADGNITAAQHGTLSSGDLHPEYARVAAPEDITSSWALRSGGSVRATPGNPPVGEVVVQVKTSTGAPSHSASQGTPCLVAPDDDVYINNDGGTSWTKQAKDSALHAVESGESGTHNHGNLYYTESEHGGVSPQGHHSNATDHAQSHSLASHSTKPHSALSDAPANAHHVAFVQADADALYDVLGGLSTHVGAGDPHTGYRLESVDLYSVHQYYFVPDAAPGDDITTGDQQGLFAQSGPSEETVKLITSHCKTAPVTSAATWQIEYGDTNDLDTVSSWTEIDLFSHTAAHKTVRSTSFTTATIPADRIIRFNVDGIGGTAAKDVNIIVEVWRPLQT